jgi:hypothetical protein
VEAELVTLATAGATTLVQQMATDGWVRVRDRLAVLLGRAVGTAGSTEEAASELEDSRAHLMAARADGDDDSVADIQDEWRLRLRRILRAEPGAAVELRALLDELQPDRSAAPSHDVHNVISGGTQYGTVIQGGDMGNVNLGGRLSGPPRRDRG